MRMFFIHVVLPGLAPAVIVGLYFTPVTLIGCVNRGAIALAVVFLSLIGAIILGMRGIGVQRNGDSRFRWFMVTMLILTLPALLVLGPLG